MSQIHRQLLQSLASGGVPLSLVQPEPEVARASLADVQCRSLAECIAGLLAEYEPLLTAERDGATIIVREKGGGAVMQVKVEAK